MHARYVAIRDVAACLLTACLYCVSSRVRAGSDLDDCAIADCLSTSEESLTRPKKAEVGIPTLAWYKEDTPRARNCEMAAAAAGCATTTRAWSSVETVLASPFSALRVWLKSDGTFPNNDAHPLLIYQRVLAGTEASQSRGAALLTENGWTSPWAWGVFPYHHYHSTAWEALLCVQGEADIQFGGPTGPTLHTDVRRPIYP